MKLLSSIALLVATALANPLARDSKEEFNLKTSNATNNAHNGLYVYSYHTGAGLSDAVLSRNASITPSFYLNGTRALTNLRTEFSWGLVATGDTDYASWEPITINAGRGSEGFAIQDGLFEWSEKSGFGGWLVCDWYHNAPQLFYLNRYYKATIPSSCSKVQLKAVAPQ